MSTISASDIVRHLSTYDLSENEGRYLSYQVYRYAETLGLIVSIYQERAFKKVLDRDPADANLRNWVVWTEAKARMSKNDRDPAAYYLLAENEGSNIESGIAGILPLVHIKSILFGNSLVSMPFLNYGGVLTEDVEDEPGAVYDPHPVA